ncbi:hypothetical protein AXI64_gp197 [Vibrio phage qdvp001]|uniref:hypothetical protein n=1 Tax=Vibrio phage qdvp001 TaxID=1003177 RepID=UPI0007228902|nr:hypothetical protein AXI64_gp197 [Vibrio phage qdvp001]ALM62189.1 hypothetical protein qdvp001_197 [Vibrio phage qdvp001]
MITLDEKDGLSWELVALLEVAAEEAGYSSPESFIIDTAVKEAGKVLALNGDKHKGKSNYVDEGDFPQEEQLDLFGEQE